MTERLHFAPFICLDANPVLYDLHALIITFHPHKWSCKIIIINNILSTWEKNWILQKLVSCPRSQSYLFVLRFSYSFPESFCVPGLERSPEGGRGNPLQYSCLENPGYSQWGCKELDRTEQLSTNIEQNIYDFDGIRVLCFKELWRTPFSLRISNVFLLLPPLTILLGFPGSSVGKGSACSAETLVWSLGWEDPLEKEMATHSCILAWKSPMDRGAWWATVHGVARVGHNLATKPSIIMATI